MHEFRCPHCSTLLRMRDERFRGQTIACPECAVPVLIQETNDGLRGVSVTQTVSKKRTESAAQTPRNPVQPPSSQSTTAPAATRDSLPLPAKKVSREFLFGIAGGIALLAFLFLFIRPFPPRNNVPPREAPSETDSVLPAEEVTSSAVAPSTVSPSSVVPAADTTDDTPSDPVRDQLFNLDAAIRKTFGEEGGSIEIPAQSETGPGWIGLIAQTALPREQVNWEAGWEAPVNDRFVRRRFPPFDNPNIPQKTGDDSYPASHYVGVSGVGADAAELPRNHPRAGIFSTTHPTRFSQITDGLSHTMMIAGVESRLHAWAAPGAAGIRSFTQEPYVNGPDGFGTGQSDRMLVLMADGSVREIGPETEPLMVRRMAAMADGGRPEQSRASTAENDLGAMSPDASAIPAVPPVPSMSELVEQKPIEVPLADESPPMVDYQPRLAQRIAHYEQSRSVRFRDLLWELEELAGIPIDASRLSEETLQKPLPVDLKNVTVEEIIHHLCQSAGVESTLGPHGLRLAPASPLEKVIGDE